MTLFEKLLDTFRLSRVRVHVPRRMPEFCNPSEVCAARAVARVNRKSFDYTEWRKGNLFVDETVDSLMDKAEALYGDSYPETT